MVIDQAPNDRKVVASYEQYSRRWKKNSTAIEAQGRYTWMADQLLPYKPIRILDFGCGLGNGLIALKRRFPNAQVVAVDENPSCLKEAQKQITRQGWSSVYLDRIEIEDRPQENGFFIAHKTGRLTGVNLKEFTFIESDLLCDPEFSTVVEAMDGFDAVTLWLIGTHLLKKNCLNLQNFELQDSHDYRLIVQNKVYAFADKLLRSGGVLQIVDRCQSPNTSEEKREHLLGHQDQASPTKLTVKSLEFTEYAESSEIDAVPMVSTRAVPRARTALISIISQKL
jgi:SAM-dependent methyltransferase